MLIGLFLMIMVSIPIHFLYLQMILRKNVLTGRNKMLPINEREQVFKQLIRENR